MPLRDRPHEREPEAERRGDHPPHDELRVPRALERAGDYYVRRVEHLPRGHEEEQLEAEGIERLGIRFPRGEERQYGTAEDDGEEREERDEREPHAERPHRVAMRRRAVSAPLRLPDERSCAHGEPLHRGEEEVVDLEASVRDRELLIADASGHEHEDREGEDVQRGIGAARDAVPKDLADKRPQARRIRRAVLGKSAQVALGEPSEDAPLDEHRGDRRVRGSRHAEARTAEHSED